MTESYVQIQHGLQGATFRRTCHQDTVTRLSTASSLRQEKGAVATSSAGWEAYSSNFFAVNDELVVDSILPSSMRLPEIDTSQGIVSSTAFIPIQTFSPSGQVRGLQTLQSFKHNVGSSTLGLSPFELSMDIPMFQTRETENECAVAIITNDWDGSAEGIMTQNRAESPQEYVNEDQCMESPVGHQFQGVLGQHEVRIQGDWPEDDLALQFSYPSGGYSHGSSIQPLRLQFENGASAPNLQHQRSRKRGFGLVRHPDCISFTTPVTWVPWAGTKHAMQCKLGNVGANAAMTLRVNQLVLRRVLMSVLPRIAKEQKAREQVASDTLASNASVRLITNSDGGSPYTEATRTENILQDSQARTHMLAERRRRVREKEHYSALRSLIPPNSRMDKATVLGETIRLVKRMKKRVRQLEKTNCGQPATYDDKKNSPPRVPGTENTQIGAAISQFVGQGDAQAMLQETQTNNKPLSITDRGTTTARFATVSVQDEDDRKESVQVFPVEGLSSHEFRAEIRIMNQQDTIIHIFTCLKELTAEVTCACINITNNWITANLRFKINTEQSRRCSLFCTAIQGALKKAMRSPGSKQELIQL